MGVVIVDDHPMVLRGVSALVEATPDMHVMATAGTAARGLDACLEHRPDVVVMDLSLPDGDGIAITRRLRESLPEARILVLSMCDDEDALFGALRAGAHGYVLKGAAHDCVVRALRSVAAGDTVFGAGVSGRVLQHFGANAPALPDPLRGLSAREREVLDLLASGLGTKEIGRRRSCLPRPCETTSPTSSPSANLADRAHAIAYDVRPASAGRRAGETP